MHAEFAAADVLPRHVLADPPDEPADVVRLLLSRYAQGTLRYEA